MLATIAWASSRQAAYVAQAAATPAVLPSTTHAAMRIIGKISE